jgi:hypothetical protein
MADSRHVTAHTSSGCGGATGPCVQYASEPADELRQSADIRLRTVSLAIPEGSAITGDERNTLCLNA